MSIRGDRNGRAAANAFIERNVNREVILKQIDLGVNIQGYVASEPDKNEGYRPSLDMPAGEEAVRVRATVEVNSPGRLFQSLKSQLRHRGFRGTQVFGEKYLIEGLTAARCGESPGISDACFARDTFGFRCVRRLTAEELQH